MQTVWIIRGANAGTFQQLADDAAKKLIAKGDAQACDGVTPLKYPVNHPDYRAEPKTRTTRKKKYPNKMMTTEVN